MPSDYINDLENKKNLSLILKAKIIKFIFETYLKDSFISKVDKVINKKDKKNFVNEKN